VGQLIASGLAERAVHARDRAPAFRLRDGNVAVFSSDKVLCVGPMLIVFYRGRWCPYRNLDPSAIQAASWRRPVCGGFCCRRLAADALRQP
jgi:hypothetical protein